MSYAILTLHVLASLFLMAFGLNCYVLIYQFHKHRRRPSLPRPALPPADSLPIITTQLPIYNEKHVATRVMRAAAEQDYPASKHQILVLDDSTDETSALIDATAAELRAAGAWIHVCRRSDRRGFKAGALAAAMDQVAGEYIAIFDADFVPAPDFLTNLLPSLLASPHIGLAQARWTHLNRDHSFLTKTQAVGIDAHFIIEQSARAGAGLFLNFNGTAGIWRKQAIAEAGGWHADTLTEDLDLSYRAQLAGWKIVYDPTVTVPAELPETISAFRSQQFRWAKGSVQTLMKLWSDLRTAPQVSGFQLAQSFFHMGNYMVYPAMLVTALLMLPVLSLVEFPYAGNLWALAVPFLLGALGPSLLTITAQRALYPQTWRRTLLMLPGMMCLGLGIGLSNTRAVVQAWLGLPSGFIRTPKRGAAGASGYRSSLGWLPSLEIGFGIYLLASFLISLLRHGLHTSLVFAALNACGFLIVGSASLHEQMRRRS